MAEKKETAGAARAPRAKAAKSAGSAAAPNGDPASSSSKPASPKPDSPKPDSAKPDAKPDTAGPQLTSLVSKVFELADASVGLGINVISLLTGFARSQAAAAGNISMTPSPAPPQEPPPASSASSTASSAAPPADPSRSYCIVNRLPIHSGDAAAVSFSINNDMPDNSKNLSLKCSNFVGATQGFAVAEGVFSVEPASAAIGPMDFERFVLKGTVPPDASADTYNGWIQVSGDEQIRIPVVLMVT